MARAMPVLPLVGSRMIVSGLIKPACSARLEHGNPDTVFYAVGRVEEFQLGDDVGNGAVGDSAQSDQRCAPDELGDVLGDAHLLRPTVSVQAQLASQLTSKSMAASVGTVMAVDLSERLVSARRLYAAGEHRFPPVCGQEREDCCGRQESTTTTAHGEAAREDKAQLYGLLHGPTIGHGPAGSVHLAGLHPR